jgi:hypothetical protein
MANTPWPSNNHSSQKAVPAVDVHNGMEGVLQSLAVPKPINAPTVDTFLETQRQYFTTLSSEEKATLSSCQSSAQLIREIRTAGLFQRSNHELRLRNSLKKVQKFAERLEPYFGAIGAIIQSKPEIAGIVWGCMRATLLVVQLGEQTTSVTDRLSLPVITLHFSKSLPIHWTSLPSSYRSWRSCNGYCTNLEGSHQRDLRLLFNRYTWICSSFSKGLAGFSSAKMGVSVIHCSRHSTQLCRLSMDALNRCQTVPHPL